MAFVKANALVQPVEMLRPGLGVIMHRAEQNLPQETFYLCSSTPRRARALELSARGPNSGLGPKPRPPGPPRVQVGLLLGYAKHPQ